MKKFLDTYLSISSFRKKKRPATSCYGNTCSTSRGGRGKTAVGHWACCWNGTSEAACLRPCSLATLLPLKPAKWGQRNPGSLDFPFCWLIIHNPSTYAQHLYADTMFSKLTKWLLQYIPTTAYAAAPTRTCCILLFINISEEHTLHLISSLNCEFRSNK